MNLFDTRVALVHSEEAKVYPDAPFSPSENFPEFPLTHDLDTTNTVYALVRESLRYLGLDDEHYGTPVWNPFLSKISPGGKVVIKPNLVFHSHPDGEAGVISMITHASVIRPIIDYILLATGGDVHITICDVPLQSAHWDELIRISGLQSLVDFYSARGVSVALSDFRYEIATQSKEGIIIARDHKVRDPLGYTAVDIGKESALMDIIHDADKLEITDYPLGTVSAHHNEEKNEYLIPNTVLECDLFINVPKLKTHRKAGMTFAMKNLIGINGDKSWIAHHRRGSQSSGGDEYQSLNLFAWLKSSGVTYLKQSQFGRLIARGLYWVYRGIFLKGQNPSAVYARGENTPITEGSWYGNDTIWRCIKDLNSIINYADKKGKLQQSPQRNYLTIGDGIIGGDKEGPMLQSPRPVGVIIAGYNPVAIDRVAASVMGFDYKKIPQIARSFTPTGRYPLCPFEEKDIVWCSHLSDPRSLSFSFIPTVNWKGHIEK